MTHVALSLKCYQSNETELETEISLFGTFGGKCEHTPDERNCMDPTPEEAIKIVNVLIVLAGFVDVLQGAVVLQICGGKKVSSIKSPKLKEGGYVLIRCQLYPLAKN